MNDLIIRSIVGALVAGAVAVPFQGPIRDIVASSYIWFLNRRGKELFVIGTHLTRIRDDTGCWMGSGTITDKDFFTVTVHFDDGDWSRVKKRHLKSWQKFKPVTHRS